MAAIVSICYLISSDRKSYNAGFARSQQPVGSVDHAISKLCSNMYIYLAYISDNIYELLYLVINHDIQLLHFF